MLQTTSLLKPINEFYSNLVRFTAFQVCYSQLNEVLIHLIVPWYFEGTIKMSLLTNAQ